MTSRGRRFRHHHAAAHTDRGENHDPTGTLITAQALNGGLDREENHDPTGTLITAQALNGGLDRQPAIRERCRPTSHVLDWFHRAMRIQHVAQAAKGWPADTPGERADKARLADAVEHIRWRLWHGQVQRALDLIGETLTSLEDMAEAALTAAAKATALLQELETYVSRQADLIIDYATAQRCDEPISTATTEGTVQWLLHRRMGTNQQMRWTPRGAHCMLKVRTAVANRFPCRGPCRRRAVGPSTIPLGSIEPPRFWTVSTHFHPQKPASRSSCVSPENEAGIDNSLSSKYSSRAGFKVMFVVRHLLTAIVRYYPDLFGVDSDDVFGRPDTIMRNPWLNPHPRILVSNPDRQNLIEITRYDYVVR